MELIRIAPELLEVTAQLLSIIEAIVPIPYSYARPILERAHVLLRDLK